MLNVVAVVGLDLDGDTAESALQGILGRGVHHLGLERTLVTMLIMDAPRRSLIGNYLDAGIIRGPSNEGQLVPVWVSACVRFAFGSELKSYRSPSPDARLYSKS